MSDYLRRLVGRMNPTARTLLASGVQLCVSRAHYEVEIEHFLLKVSESEHTDFDLVAKAFSLDRSKLNFRLLSAIDELKAGNASTPCVSPRLIRLLTSALTHGTLLYGTTDIRTGFILAVLLESESASLVKPDVRTVLETIDAVKLATSLPDFTVESVEGELAPLLDIAGKDRAAGTGPRVFFSYRRDDSTVHADLLYVLLQREVPDAYIFRDSDTLSPGVLFPDVINENIAACDIMVAIIGRKWLGAKRSTPTRRIDLADDWVRREVAAALQLGKLVIPVLIGGANMPSPDKLPSDLAGLASRQAVRMSENALRRDAGELIRHIKNWKPQ